MVLALERLGLRLPRHLVRMGGALRQHPRAVTMVAVAAGCGAASEGATRRDDLPLIVVMLTCVGLAALLSLMLAVPAYRSRLLSMEDHSLSAYMAHHGLYQVGVVMATMLLVLVTEAHLRYRIAAARVLLATTCAALLTVLTVPWHTTAYHRVPAVALYVCVGVAQWLAPPRARVSQRGRVAVTSLQALSLVGTVLSGVACACGYAECFVVMELLGLIAGLCSFVTAYIVENPVTTGPALGPPSRLLAAASLRGRDPRMRGAASRRRMRATCPADGAPPPRRSRPRLTR